MIKLEDVKIGDILYAINLNKDDIKVEEFKVKSILRKNPIFTQEYNRFYTLTLENENNEIRYIRIVIQRYNANRRDNYLPRYIIFRTKKCRIQYTNDIYPVYNDELDNYIISFERDYLVDKYITQLEKNLERERNELESVKNEIERLKLLINKLQKL